MRKSKTRQKMNDRPNINRHLDCLIAAVEAEQQENNRRLIDLVEVLVFHKQQLTGSAPADQRKEPEMVSAKLIDRTGREISFKYPDKNILEAARKILTPSERDQLTEVFFIRNIAGSDTAITSREGLDALVDELGAETLADVKETVLQFWAPVDWRTL